MSHFRRMLLAVSAVGVFLGWTGTAQAQGSNPFVCNTSFSPLVVRVEGLRELVGDIVISCTGGNAVGPYWDNVVAAPTFQLANNQILNASRLSTSASVNAAPGANQSTVAPAINLSVSVLGSRVTNRVYSGTNLTDALLFIDDPVNPVAAFTRANQRLCTAQDATTGQYGVCKNLNYWFENGFAQGAGFVGDTSPTNVFQGQYGVGGGFVPNEQTVTFVGIPVVQPGPNGGTRIYRIKNIRVQVANTLTLGGQIQAFLSIQNPPANLVLNNAQGVVGFVQRGLVFDTVTAGPVAQCTGLNFNVATGAFWAEKTGLSGQPLINIGVMRYTEGYGVAFKRRGFGHPNLDAFDATYNQFYVANAGQANPTVNYNNESGFYNLQFGSSAALDTKTIGVASTGTRLRARLTGIPANVRTYVTAMPVVGFGATLGLTSSFAAIGQGFGAPGSAHLLSGVDANGNNTSGAAGATFNTSYAFNVTPNGFQGIGAPGWGSSGSAYDLVSGALKFGGYNYYNQLTVAADGTATAVWEVLRADDNVIDQLSFGVAFAFLPTTSIVTDANTSVSIFAAGNFAPIGTTGGNGYPYIPSFVLSTPENPQAVATIVNCATNLLYPFVTSVSGFNTGIAVTNASKDPFGTANETGICRVFFYGTTTGGGIGDQVQTFSKSVPAGQVATFNLLYGGPEYGVQPIAGFQGYAIASCNFRWAHGFAFISDPANLLTAHGYLALVLDQPLFPRRNTGSTAEQLDN